MEVLMRLLKKFQRTAVIIISLILASSFVITAYELGELGKNYFWRMATYIIFAVVFVFVLTFREELSKNEK